MQRFWGSLITIIGFKKMLDAPVGRDKWVPTSSSGTSVGLMPKAYRSVIRKFSRSSMSILRMKNSSVGAWGQYTALMTTSSTRNFAHFSSKQDENGHLQVFEVAAMMIITILKSFRLDPWNGTTSRWRHLRRIFFISPQMSWNRLFLGFYIRRSRYFIVMMHSGNDLRHLWRFFTSFFTNLLNGYILEVWNTLTKNEGYKENLYQN